MPKAAGQPASQQLHVGNLRLLRYARKSVRLDADLLGILLLLRECLLHGN